MGRLNNDKRGRFLGNFDNGDALLAIYKNGEYEMTNYELTNRYENIELLQKFNPENIISAIYTDGIACYVKRFKIETSSLDKKFLFITEAKGSKLLLATTGASAQVEIIYEDVKTKKTDKMEYDLDVMGKVQGWKSSGTKLTSNKIVTIKFIHIEVEKKDEIDVEKKNGGPTSNQLGLF